MGGTTLDLLLSADDERGVVVFPGSAKPQPQLSVTLAGEDKPIVIDASATDWQVLDESAPDAGRWHAATQGQHPEGTLHGRGAG